MPPRQVLPSPRERWARSVTTCAKKDYPTRVEVIGTEGRITLENNIVTEFHGKGDLTDDLLSAEYKAIVAEWKELSNLGKATGASSD